MKTHLTTCREQRTTRKKKEKKGHTEEKHIAKCKTCVDTTTAPPSVHPDILRQVYYMLMSPQESGLRKTEVGGWVAGLLGGLHGRCTEHGQSVAGLPLPFSLTE